MNTDEINFNIMVSFENQSITALGIVPIGVAIPPIEKHAIESIKNFENYYHLSMEITIKYVLHYWKHQ